MSDGLSTTVANAALNSIVGTNAAYVELHTGAPGSAGTVSTSSVTTRMAQTWSNPASAGTITATGTPTWSSWAGTSGEVVTDVALWSASSSGTFGLSCALPSPGVTLHMGDTIEITVQSVSIPTAS